MSQHDQVTLEVGYIYWIQSLQSGEDEHAKLYGAHDESEALHRITLIEEDPGDFARFEIRRIKWEPWHLAPDSDAEERWILVDSENGDNEHPDMAKYDSEEKALIAAAAMQEECPTCGQTQAEYVNNTACLHEFHTDIVPRLTGRVTC